MAVRALVADRVYSGDRLHSGAAVLIDAGRVVSVGGPIPEGVAVERLPGMALFPGWVNGHSHAFQRAIRGRTEWRPSTGTDDFWGWREAMYSAADRLGPDEVYDVSRMCFLEMALSGITTVGEFHYLHHQKGGAPYGDPDELAKRVVQAALDVGLRICLLRVAYARGGFERPTDPRQLRFVSRSPDEVLRSVGALRSSNTDPRVTFGLAPHSVRAVPHDWFRPLVGEADRGNLPIHMHLAEQPREIDESVAEHGLRPVHLCEEESMLGPRFTAVHAIHLHPSEAAALNAAGSTVCACPTTERNLGDGIVPADRLERVSLGTDSQVQIDLLEDARELEYHLRLQSLRRAVLQPAGSAPGELAARLVASLTTAGARSLGVRAGALQPGEWADLVAVDLQHASLLGCGSELLSGLVFGAGASAVRGVAVAGEWIVRDGRHPRQSEITRGFAKAMSTVWGDA